MIYNVQIALISIGEVTVIVCVFNANTVNCQEDERNGNVQFFLTQFSVHETN